MTHVADQIAVARSRIDNLSPQDAAAEIAGGGAVVVDLREPEERAATGEIPGAIAAARGMLEFYADANTPYHREEFDPSRRMILYCASGGRSALAGATLRDLGFADVAHIDGGIKAWEAAGLEVAPVKAG
ncbi:MAG: rhodanese-like domain-containing protein [Thermomicrobiales bacterium]